MFSLKNIILFIVLLAIGVFTYFHEEIGKNRKLELLRHRSMLIDIHIDQLQLLKMPNLAIEKKANRLAVLPYDYPVDQEILNELLKKLGGVTIVKDITDSVTDVLLPQAFDKDSINFSYQINGRKIDLLIGRQVPLTGNFYVKKNIAEKISYYVCKDESTLDVSYKPDEEMDKRYQFLLQRLQADHMQFVVKNPLYEVDFSSIKNVRIDNIRNRHFEIDFTKGQTKPAPLDGIKYLSRQFRDIVEKFKNISIVQIFELQRDKLVEKLSEVELSFADHKKMLTLYRKYDDKSGYFLLIAGEKLVYELSGISSTLFFFNVSDFWDKRPHINRELGKEDIFFKVRFDSGQGFDLKIPRGKYFDVTFVEGKMDSSVINRENFRKLFSILFSVGEYEQAFRISPIDSSYSRIEGASITIEDRELKMLNKNDEIILVDREEGYALHYLIPQTTLKIDFSQFFE